jgi:hypothetical protein
VTGQYKHLGGCLEHDDTFPKVTHVNSTNVVLFQNASIWRLSNDDYIEEIH